MAEYRNHVWGLDLEVDETTYLPRLQLLNITEFGSLTEARVLIGDWKRG